MFTLTLHPNKRGKALIFAILTVCTYYHYKQDKYIESDGHRMTSNNTSSNPYKEHWKKANAR